MVDFNIGSAVFYDAAANTDPGNGPVGENLLISAIDDNDVLTDADGVLTAGEQFILSGELNLPGFPALPYTITFEYAGTVTIGTTTVPVFQQIGSSGNAFLDFAYPSGVYGIISNLELPSFESIVGTPASIDFTNDLVVETVAICFLGGTQVSVPDGTCAVEALSIGDPILTANGDTVPVKWIGKQTVFTAFRPADRLRPVRVTAGALGDGLPRRDLLLTQDHALLIDGLLVNAGALVNGSTILHEPLDAFDGSYTVYHVETEAHDVILAEGTPAETYIDYTARHAFDNFAEYVALYGEDRSIPEMAYPRISSTRMLPTAIKLRLATPTAA